MLGLAASWELDRSGVIGTGRMWNAVNRIFDFVSSVTTIDWRFCCCYEFCKHEVWILEESLGQIPIEK
jgi:hypothetical protein